MYTYYVFTYIYIYIYTHMYVHVYIYIYIHTCIEVRTVSCESCSLVPALVSPFCALLMLMACLGRRKW